MRSHGSVGGGALLPPFVVRVLKYGVASGLSVLMTLGSSYFAYHWLKMPDSLAQAMGFIVGTAVNYPLNRVWTFRNHYHNTGLQFAIFLAVALVGLGFNELALYLSVTRLHLLVLEGMIVGILVGFISNFSLNNWVTFKRFS